MFANLFEGEAKCMPELIGKAGVAETRIVTSITQIGRKAWNDCFADEIENYDYLLAVERAGIKGFHWRYVAIMQNGRVVAVMPAFLMEYQLETTLTEGSVRRLIRGIRRTWSSFLSLRLGCLGSPCTESGSPGFHSSIPYEMRPFLLRQILDGFRRMADEEGCALRGIKDVPETLPASLRAEFAADGYAVMPSLPTAWLDIDFASIEEYLAKLSPGTRKDMRRKLRSRELVSVDYHSDISTILPRFMELYNDTRNRSEWQFEALTDAYFTGILQHMPGRAFCTIYKVGERVLAANIFVCDGDTLIDKFFCMDAEAGRRYNLYYLSWFNNIDYCLQHGLRRYQSGQAYYENKIRLGSQLTRNMIFFRHRNSVIQSLLKIVSPVFAIDYALDA